MDFAKVLSEVASFLESQHVRFGLVGAFALQAYGLMRATADLDWVVESKAAPLLRAHLESLGYETLHASEGYSNHLHPLAPLGRLDFIYVDDSTADQLFRDARAVRFAGATEVLVPRPEHLVAMKVLAIKNDPSRTFQELADIQFLMSLPDVDQEVIRREFQRHALMEKYDELKKALSAART